MSDDEAQIRELVEAWMRASRAGDVETVLRLMTDDVVFLVPGRGPMRKAEFEAASRMQASAGGARVDGTSEIEELQVVGDLAFMRTRLHVIATPSDGSPAIERAGYALTILRKEGGRWRLARDANLLAPVDRI